MIQTVVIGLSAVVVAIRDGAAVVLTLRPRGQAAGLPFGPFDPEADRTFELALRSFVTAQTRFDLGYVEQLYTFGDRGRHARPDDTGMHMISVGYLALTRMSDNAAALREASAGFEPWYRFFPWEDWRDGRPGILDQTIVPLLEQWAKTGKSEPSRPLGRRERMRHCFAVGGSPWDEEKVLDRYELLYEAGLVEEARRDGREANVPRAKMTPLGEAMRFDTLYVALGVEPRNDLAEAAGVRTNDDGYLVAAQLHQDTAVPGLYAAGDVVRGLNQLSVAQAEAAIAATAIHNRLRDQDGA